jgi:phospholipid/cholesterol/gamma-HCH transport system ATP-binding protein
VNALVIRDLSVVIDGRTLLRDANAQFARGTVHAVVGRSGAGKSVLMKAACGLLKSAIGTVTLDDITARAGDADTFSRLRAKAVFVHQDPALLDDLTLRENIAFAGMRLLSHELCRTRVDHAIERLSLRDVEHALPREVSPGVLRRAALARALVLEPAFLIVDEPTTGVDPETAREIDRALADVATRETTLIVVTHDRRSIATLRPRLTFVENATVAWQGTLDEARAHGPDTLARLLFDRAHPSTAAPARPTEGP